jgi:hypothetical protein
MPILKSNSLYVRKDQAKSDRANKFIGKGCPHSSTESYRLSWGALANCGEYVSTDTVFISVNGMRAYAVPPQYAEIGLAIKARATLITDIPSDRSRSYNVGERKVTQFLENNDYVEVAPGTWKPVQ